MKCIPCSCGCLERRSVSPIFEDPRGGSQTQEDVRPHQHQVEPDPDQFDEWVRARSSNWVQELEAVFGVPSVGRNRCVFQGRRHVYKVPRNPWGLEDNLHEAAHMSCHLASAWIVHDADGFPLLVMERVRPVGSMVDWTWGVDCGQVGRSYRTGQLVAFDYGLY